MTPRAIKNALWIYACTGVVGGGALASNAIAPDVERYRRLTRLWARGIARGIGLCVVTRGAALDPDRKYVLLANHQSHIDIVALLIALPMTPGFLAKAELRKIPLFGRAMEVGGHVFVDRKKHRASVDTLAAAAKDLRASIIVFPEGTRSVRREVLPFKKGGFHLAKAAGVPIVPIGIRGSAAILAKHSREVRPGTVEVHIGEPIDVAELSIEAMMDVVRAQILALSALPSSTSTR